MNFELKSLDLAGAAAEKSEALVVLVPEALAKSGKSSLSLLIEQSGKAGDFEGKAGKLLQTYRVDGVAAPKVVLAGMGDGSAKQVRQAVSAACAVLKGSKIKKLVLAFASTPQAGAIRAAVLAVADTTYVYTTTKPKAEGRSLTRVLLGLPEAAPWRAELALGQALATGIEFTKEWGNRPANHATPTLLAQAAKGLTKLAKIKCEVLGPREVEKLGMHTFMSVAQGSKEPLRFIVLRYEGAAKTAAPHVLVGKGITFDTGGISIKPSAEMDEMKFDMCGAASVLGVFRALGEIQPNINVVGLIPACENMPDGGAVKPGDVVTSMSGQTVENLNTDAEGRLVLCDALHYAARFKPAAVIDIATLTGACVVALGGVRSGVFANDDGLAQALLEAGDTALDPGWRLPLDDEYGEGLKSNFADVANVAGRAGGAVTAAKFLQRFVGTTRWGHLDIAGTAWRSGAAKGATGRPVGLLVHYLLGQAGSPAKTVTPRTAARRQAVAKTAPRAVAKRVA
ncbi:leucyl aminopeptidase [Variovorax sp. HJSM1_2]|uniref:leucyl aminopeptidase n=1 Tax=Variovorax sp. HJSM1_2 TaxID=3366263 RepID=UPI003BBF1B6A